MANPLKFEITIGNELSQQIERYKKALNEMLRTFDGKKITIGVDSKLSELMGQLVQSFRDINQQQVESTRNLKAVTQYINQQQQALAGVVEAQKGATADTKAQAEAQGKLNGIKSQSVQATNAETQAVEKNTAAKEKNAQAAVQPRQGNLFDITQAEKLENELRQHANTIDTIIARINEALSKMGQGVDVEASLQKFRQGVSGLTSALEPFEKALQTLSSYGGDFARVVPTMVTATQQLAKSLATVSEAQKGAVGGGDGSDSAKKKVQDWIEQLRKLDAAQSRMNKKNGGMSEQQRLLADANKWLSEIIGKIGRYQTLVSKAQKLNIDTSDLEKAIAELKKWRQQAEALQKSGGKLSNGATASSMRFDPAYVGASTSAKVAASALNLQYQEAKASASATSHLTSEQERLAQAFNNATKEARGQSQVISDLKSLIYQYFSVYGAQQFLTEMVNITGELELQRKSLEVILGSGTAASEMYTQLRDLSQQSPYTFEDLLKAHRQLAAFGIEAKDIYGTMKSLTDIGAGLDVDVSRLILAYGHTRSYGYLSGIQNRQFETAGIDLVGALTDLYNRRADAAKQRGQVSNYVSRKDIFGLMRKRDIPFEDVQEVILDLDKPGGKFYNMQERQYNTLGGKLRNLRNNYRIMLSEMGGSSHGVWMGLVDTLNEVTGNWDKYAKVLGAVAVAYGAVKAAQMAMGRTMLAQNAAMKATISSARRDYRAMTFLNTIGKGKTGYRFGQNFGLTFGGYNTANTTDAKLAEKASVKAIANNKELTNIQKQRIALTAKLTQAQRAYLLTAAGINGQQARTIARFGAFRRGLLSLRLGFMQATAAARAFLASMLPQAGIMAAIAGIAALISHSLEASRKAEEISKQFREESETNKKTAEEMLQGYVTRRLIELNPQTRYDALGNAITTNSISFNRENMAGANLASDIDEMKKKLQVLSPIYDGDLLDINKMEGQEQQFEALINKIEAIRRANEVQESIAADLANADKRVAGGNGFTRMFGDTFSEDMKDYSEAVKDMRERLQKAFTDTDSDYYTSNEDLGAIDDATGGMLTAIKGERGLTTYQEALQVYFEKIAQMTVAERDKEYKKLQQVLLRSGYSGVSLFNDVAGGGNFGKSLNTQFEQMKKDAAEWSKSLGYDIIANFSKDPQGAVAAMINSVNSFLSSAGVTDPTTKQAIVDAVIENLKKNQSFTVSGSYGDLNLQKANIGDLYGTALVKEQFGQYLSGLNGSMDDEEALAIFNQAYTKIEKFISDRNIVIRGLGAKTTKEWLKGLYEGQLSSLRAGEAWMERAKKTLTLNTDLTAKINTYVDIYAFAEDVQKKLKEARDKVEKMIPHIKTLQVRMGINFDLSATTSADQIKKQRKKLEDKLGQDRGRYNLGNDAFKKSQEGQALLARVKLEEELVKAYSDIETTLGSEKQMEAWNKQEGFSDADEEKRRKKREQAAQKAKSAREKRWRDEDSTLIKDLSARQKNLSDAYKTYWEWYERLGKNEQAAMAEVRKRFTIAQISNEDLKNLQSQEGYIHLLLDFIQYVDQQAKKLHFGKENKDRIESIKVSTSGTIDQTRQKQFDDAAKKYTSELDLQVKRLEKQYDLYKKIYDLTGDRGLAFDVSGRPVSEGSKADDIRQAIQNNVSDAVVSMKLPNISNLSIDFDKIRNLDDEGITRYVGTIFNEDKNKELIENNGTLQQMIAGVVEKLKEWRNLQEQIDNEAKETYANLRGGLNTFVNVLKKADAEFERTKELLGISLSNGDIDQTQYNEGITIAEGRRDRTIMEARPVYKNLMAGNTAYNPGVLQAGGRQAISQLTAQLQAGSISADEYAQKVKAINDAMEKLDNQDMTSMLSTFINQGWQGVLDRRLQTSKDEQTKATQRMEAANADVKSAEAAYKKNPTKANKEQLDNAKKTSEQAKKDSEDAQQKVEDNQKTSNSYKAFAKAVNETIKVMGDLNNAVSLLSSVFDSLGMGDTAVGQAASDTSDLLGGMLGGASSLSALGPWGMAAGAGLGLISGLAGLHDKHAQQRIEKLQEDVSKIEGYTETISKAQERTLGFDTSGDIIRAYQKQYAANSTTLSTQLFGLRRINKEGAAGLAMADYYNSAGTSADISGYQQQYNMLVAKRKDYIDMYNTENSKKKKSKESLREYQEQIAELDDEIKYFAEDLASSLYGIDLKSWADQLGDALMTAFENGEDAAEAFDNSVTSILQGLVKKMVSVGIFEPLFERLRKSLFGTDGVSGSFDINDPNGSRNAWMKDINEALGEDGYIRDGMEAAQTLFDSMEGMANVYGNTLLNNDSASMSSSIKGITEQTADLLAAYLNAIRADVSVMRQLMGSKHIEYMDTMSAMAQSQVQYQSQIAQNTLRNAEAAETMMRSTEEILVLFRAVTNDTKRVSVNAH